MRVCANYQPHCRWYRTFGSWLMILTVKSGVITLAKQKGEEVFTKHKNKELQKLPKNDCFLNHHLSQLWSKNRRRTFAKNIINNIRTFLGRKSSSLMALNALYEMVMNGFC